MRELRGREVTREWRESEEGEGESGFFLRARLLAAAVDDGCDDGVDAVDVEARAKVLGHLSGVGVLLPTNKHDRHAHSEW